MTPAIREHRPLLLISAAALLASLVAERAAGLGGLTLSALGNWHTYSFFLLMAAVPLPLLLGGALWQEARERGGEQGWRLPAAWRRARSAALANDRLLGALIATLCVALVINLFSSWKLAIPRVQPFAWDEAFHRLDVALHGGRMPWEWLQPLLGRVPATRLLDAVYLMWHPVVGLGVAGVVWSGERRLRMRFLVAFALAWLLLGAVAAMAFSSAGPCYWEAVVGGPSPYAGLFEYLRATDGTAPLAALRIQEGLWTRYASGAGAAYSGISAMPSLHVAILVLFVVAALAWRRWWLALAGAAFALLTLLGSVHLGWHYAVDGYAGAAGVLVLWWVAGQVTRGTTHTEAGMRKVAANGRTMGSGRDPWAPDPESRPPFWREHRGMLALMGAYIAVGFVVDWSGLVPGMMGQMRFIPGYLITPVLALAAAPIAIAVQFGRVLREGGGTVGQLTWSDWPRAWRRCRQEMLNRQRLAAVAAVTLAFPVFLTAFGNWKSAIPRIQPFAWDRTFHQLDGVLHLGHQPWELLQPIVGSPRATDVIDFAYGWWILLIPVVLSWQAWSGRWEVRRRFLMGVVLVWVALGTIGAVAFSSAGPCFYGYITGDPQAYGGLIRYLREVDGTHRLYAVETQDLLWRVYQFGSANPFLRISAMPSVHVAFAGLCAVLGWATNRALGVALTAYAVLILVGSVHLGWHYAVDGYVSLLALGPIWWAAGRSIPPRRPSPDGRSLSAGSTT